MKRDEAFALVRQRGGAPRRGVTKQTGVLIVGEFGWPLLDNGRPSNSLAQAQSYGVPIASERQFLEWIGKAVPDQQAKTYTADQLASLSKVAKEVVDQLAMFGLIECRDGLYGFRDLTAARQIAGLLAAGVTMSLITRSLHDIRRWLPEAHLSNLRLFPESCDNILIEQMKGRTDKTGQFVLPIAEPQDSPDTLFEQAQLAEEAKEVVAAERLYRRVMQIDPADPAAPFNLGNLLRSEGRIVEAEAAYRAAVNADPGFADAWYNLADVFDDQGRAKDALACLESAVKANPEYADAMFNLALFLQRLERHGDALAWWRRYLELDKVSPWAARARRALKFCEMEVARLSREHS
jgi:tetratricopeptide (TPR) repeat protein